MLPFRSAFSGGRRTAPGTPSAGATVARYLLLALSFASHTATRLQAKSFSPGADCAFSLEASLRPNEVRSAPLLLLVRYGISLGPPND